MNGDTPTSTVWDAEEYALRQRAQLGPYKGIARATGYSLDYVLRAVVEKRLGEVLFTEDGHHVDRPLTPAQALHRLEEQRYAPGTEPPTPAQMIGELNARRAIWEAEVEEGIR